MNSLFATEAMFAFNSKVADDTVNAWRAKAAKNARLATDAFHASKAKYADYAMKAYATTGDDKDFDPTNMPKYDGDEFEDLTEDRFSMQPGDHKVCDVYKGECDFKPEAMMSTASVMATNCSYGLYANRSMHAGNTERAQHAMNVHEA